MPTEELKQPFASGIKIRKEERDPKKGRRTGEEGLCFEVGERTVLSISLLFFMG